MRTSQKITAAVVGIGLAGAAAVALPAVAAETTPGPTPTSSATSTPDGSAQRDFRTARLQAWLDTLVSKSTITRAQADAILAEAQADHRARSDGPAGAAGAAGPAGHGGKGVGMRGGELLATAATTLGLSEDSLRAELATKSLGQIADARTVPRPTLEAALTKAMTAQLEDRVDDLIDRAPGRRTHHDGPSPSASPTDPTTAPSAPSAASAASARVTSGPSA